MPNRSSTDVNVIAHKILEEATHEKNAAAVALGRLGGLKGGNARAAILTSTQRSTIAKAAAEKRWSKTTPKKKASTSKRGPRKTA